MPSKSIVRVTVPEDKEEIWRLFHLMFSETHMFSLSEKKVDAYLDRFINPKSIPQDDTGTRGFIGVIGPVGALEGVIILTIVQYWYTNEMCLDEWINFVDPKHRKSNHSRALIGYAKNIVDQMNPFYPDLKLVIGILSTVRTAAKVRLYGQMMKPCGALYTYPALAAAEAAPLRRLYNNKGHHQ